MNEIVNSWWMYLLAAIVVCFVLIACTIFIIRAYKQASVIGMDKKILHKTVLNSCLFSILPSLSILLGIIVLSGKIGLPLPWIRLSVIGALHYELTAVDAAYAGVTIATLSPQMFATIAVVMTLCILTGPLFCLFGGFKAYDTKLVQKAFDTKENKRSFGDILFSAAFIALICSFLAEEFAKLKNIGVEGITPLESFTPTVVVLVAFGCNLLFNFIGKKTNKSWIKNMSLGVSMLIAMGVAVLLG